MLTPTINRRWLGAGAHLAILAGLALLPFIQPLLTGEVINSGDVRTLYLPHFLEVRRQLYSGELPVWNAYTALGEPLTTVVDAVAIYYPLTHVLLALPDPFRAFTLDWPIHFFIAGLSMYVFLRGHRLAGTSALLGAVAYMLSAYMFHRIIHPSNLRPIALLPLALAFVDLGLRRNFIYFLAAGLVLGLQILGGHPQSAAYCALATAAYAGWQALVGAPRQALRQRLGVAAAGLTLTVAVGLGLGAVQWVPMVEMRPYSERASVAPLEFFSSSAYDVRNLPQAVLPFIYGRPADGTFWGSRWDHASVYVGIAALLLIPLAFTGRHRRLALFLVGLAAFGFVAALGSATPFVHVLHRLPVINAFRAPSRFLVYYAFGLAVLAALGLEALREGRAPRLTRLYARWLPAAAVMSLAGAAALWLWRAPVHAWFHSVVADLYAGRGWLARLMTIEHAERQAYHMAQLEHAPDTLGLSLLLLGACLAACAWLFRARWQPDQLGLAAAGVLAADLLVVGLSLGPLHTIPAEYYTEPPDSLAALPREAEPYRVLSWDGTVFRNGSSPFSADVYGVGEERVLWWDGDGFDPDLYLREREILPPIVPAVYQLESYNAYGGLRPQQWLDVTALLDDTPTPEQIGHRHLLDLLNVRYVLSSVPLDVPGLRLVNDGMVKVYENTTALPRAYLVTNWRIVPDDAAALAALAQGEPTADHAIVVGAAPEPAPASGLDARPPSRGTVRRLETTSSAAQLQVEVEQPSLLVLSNWYHPGWRAVVNGEPAPLLKANYMGQAVYLEPGENTVVVEFRSRSLALGAMATAATLLFVALWAGSVALWRMGYVKRLRLEPGY